MVFSSLSLNPIYARRLFFVNKKIIKKLQKYLNR